MKKILSAARPVETVAIASPDFASSLMLLAEELAMRQPVSLLHGCSAVGAQMLPRPVMVLEWRGVPNLIPCSCCLPKISLSSWNLALLSQPSCLPSVQEYGAEQAL
ncbi:uncharacterized protein ACIB01_009130 [Guaruba guarouba]